MGKNKTRAGANRPATPADKKSDQTPLETLEDLRNNPDLWYKSRVLVYDLHNMSKDKTCEKRTLQTTDSSYISEPYFTADEAAAVRAIRASHDDGAQMTLRESISTELKNFFEKRRASGDCRPCGPHDLGPVYLSCFGMEKADIQDEKFVSRVRRSGLGKN